jgi:hypothetical protein
MLGFIFHNQYFHMVYYMLLGLGKKPQPGPIRKKPKKKETNGRVKKGHGSNGFKVQFGVGSCGRLRMQISGPTESRPARI